MIPNEKILQCIYNINTLIGNIQSVNVELEKLNIKSDTPCHDDLTRYSYLKICTFLDEIVILNSIAKEDLHLRDIMASIKPLMLIASKYEKGFRQARDSMLAHLNRDKSGNFKPAWLQLKSMKLPRGAQEMNLIYGSLDLIRVIFIDLYRDEFREFHKSIVEEVQRESQYFIYSIEPALDFNLVIDEVEKRLKEKGLIDSRTNFRMKFAPLEEGVAVS